MSDFEKQLEVLVERVVRRVLAESTPLDDDARDKIAERLVFIFHIYNGHKVDHRGPAGCIMDVLDIVAPSVSEQIRDGVSADAIYAERWAEE